MHAVTSFYIVNILQCRIQGSPLLFLDQNEARRAEKKFFVRPPPPSSYLRVWMTEPPSPPPLIWKSGSATVLGLCYPGFQRILFSYRYWRFAAKPRESYQTVSTVYFILGILRTDLWSQGRTLSTLLWNLMSRNLTSLGYKCQFLVNI